MTPDEYNAARLASGELSVPDITTLVRHWQATHGLVADGKFGPRTKTSLGPQPWLHCPLPVLPDGRKAQITSGFKTSNPSRPDHDGIDWFYPWMPGDKPDFVGDGGAATKLPSGQPKWGVPFGTFAVAAAGGTVTRSSNTRTGWRCWIDHGNGFQTGYFHLLDLVVSPGDRVVAGHPLGLVGDNPVDKDARHLHFELSPSDRYEPIDPTPHLIA